MSDRRARARLAHVSSALASSQYTSGSTHNFYLYPARFSPEIARAVIEAFSAPGDWVLDPFMGGGTAIIEGLMLGRSMVGIDLNALACFVADVRTRPLSGLDGAWLRWWAATAAGLACGVPGGTPQVPNLPSAVRAFVAQALMVADAIPLPRRRAFARCVLLRLGQWALDCRDQDAPSRRDMAHKLIHLTDQFLAGVRAFADVCGASGVAKSAITARRVLLCRDAMGIEDEPRVTALPPPRLVFTSPPYAGVHVLYHRWQVCGRRETPAPYWIAGVPDGYYASHYTGGSRTPTGERNYFGMIQSAFASVARLMAPDGMVVQLVGFANAATQLPLYLDAMEAAGFEPCMPSVASAAPLRRTVPNRKWYAKLQGPVDASSELLLFHRLCAAQVRRVRTYRARACGPR